MLTPERFEKIKRVFGQVGILTGPMAVELLLAALEESQQEQEYAKQQAIYWNDEAVKFKGQLTEAQQTIARQREALNFYASEDNHRWRHIGNYDECESSAIHRDRGKLARAALGNKEGSNKA